MEKPYEKRLNLSVDLRNPNYKRAYDYIMEHPRGKFRFICDCVLQVMEGQGMAEPREIRTFDSQQVLESLSKDPYWMETFAQVVAQYVPSVQAEQTRVEELQAKPNDVVPRKTWENAHPDEEKRKEDETPSYDGPVLDFDMLAGLSAWDDLME